MSRRSTPERLEAARRAATLARIVSAGMLRERASVALAGWEAGKAQGGRTIVVDDWEVAYREIAGGGPPSPPDYLEDVADARTGDAETYWQSA